MNRYLMKLLIANILLMNLIFSNQLKLKNKLVKKNHNKLKIRHQSMTLENNFEFWEFNKDLKEVSVENFPLYAEFANCNLIKPNFYKNDT